MYWGWATTEMTISENKITINSDVLLREVVCDILLPGEIEPSRPMNLLLLNDGQEAESLGLKQTLQTLCESNRINPVIIVAIHAGEERWQEYGVAGKPDYKKRGAKADLYTEFIKEELLPAIAELFPAVKFVTTAIAGFSLGRLSALDIAWNNPELFNKVGVFSGSLWWRGKELGKGYTDEIGRAHV